MATQKITMPRLNRWEVEKRMDFIDFRLQWDGRINRSDLMDYFGISSPQASADISRYVEIAPNNIQYDKNKKTYRATAFFEPIAISSDANSYFAQLLISEARGGTISTHFYSWLPPADVAQRPTRHIPANVLKCSILAMRESKSLKIIYQSMNRLEPTERIISPHTFGFDGFRWHLRAYCHEQEDFRDFVLARILDIEIGQLTEIKAKDDKQWFHEVDLIIAPHPDLTASQRKCIEIDYGMNDGLVVFKTRQALLFYVLRLMHFDHTLHQSAETQQIILVNREYLIQLIK